MSGSSKFLDLLGRMLNGDDMRWDDFLTHFDMQNEAPPAGPGIGSTLPEFALPDQTGAMRSRAELQGRSGLLLVFVRSAHWCGYCRNQLGELNLALPHLRAAGLSVAAIAPDAPDVVAEFAAAAGLAYPLLSDDGAVFIERIGLLNENVRGSDRHNDGRIPFPAHLLISANGRVLASEVVPDLRHRPSAATLVMQAIGPTASNPHVTIEHEALKADIFLATNHLYAGQEIGLRAKIAIKPGWHLYGAHDRYRALSLRFDDALLAGQKIDLPSAKDTFFAEFNETAPAYEGVVEASGTLRLAWSPPVHGSRHLPGLAERLATMQTAPGEYVLRGWLDYQACGDGVCLPPESTPFEFPLTIAADLDKTRPYFADEMQDWAGAQSTNTQGDTRPAK
jgi:peroxiredoxin